MMFSPFQDTESWLEKKSSLEIHLHVKVILPFPEFFLFCFFLSYYTPHSDRHLLAEIPVKKRRPHEVITQTVHVSPGWCCFPKGGIEDKHDEQHSLKAQCHLKKALKR